MTALKPILLSIYFYTCHSWISPYQGRYATLLASFPHRLVGKKGNEEVSRRDYLSNAVAFGSSLVATSLIHPSSAFASTDSPAIAAEVTDKVFVDIKGLPTAEGSVPTTQRIVIGLFGKEAPQSVGKLKQLMGPSGLPAVCKPKEERVLQREQLEANKVYNSCMEGESKGVNYDYAQVWRIVKDGRIDFGSVAGKYIAREYPTWEESKPNNLRNDRAGIVSVRKGSNSGFGFTIFPGGDGDVEDLDDNHIVVGQVLEGLDVIEVMNNLPVVASAKVNYKAITGGTVREGPSRACRYGGTQLYCNENKPLTKLTLYQTGVL